MGQTMLIVNPSVMRFTFDVPMQRWSTVLDALLYAKAHEDSAIRDSCRIASWNEG